MVWHSTTPRLIRQQRTLRYLPDITVDEWTYTNGQEGFGLMAADRVGENGDSGIFWNNSYMLSATKVEYLWDATEGKVSDAGDKYTMKLGIGSQEKIGCNTGKYETTVLQIRASGLP